MQWCWSVSGSVVLNSFDFLVHSSGLGIGRFLGNTNRTNQNVRFTDRVGAVYRLEFMKTDQIGSVTEPRPPLL